MLTLRNKKLDRRFYLKIVCCDQTYARSTVLAILVYYKTNFLPSLHKAHIVFSTDILYLRLRNDCQEMEAAESELTSEP